MEYLAQISYVAKSNIVLVFPFLHISINPNEKQTHTYNVWEKIFKREFFL
jgi:hypothetical protein